MELAPKRKCQEMINLIVYPRNLISSSIPCVTVYSRVRAICKPVYWRAYSKHVRGVRAHGGADHHYYYASSELEVLDRMR